MTRQLLTLGDIALETMPFADQLNTWCHTHPEFHKALKIIYSERFLHLGAISITTSPNYPNDEVLGIFAYDYRLKTPRFKQDFIVNKNRQYREFTLYTRNKNNNNSKYVKDIKEFYLTHGKGGYYTNAHHPTFSELPDSIKPRALKVIKDAELILKFGLKQIPQDYLNEIHNQILSIKKSKNWKDILKGNSFGNF